MIDPRFTRTSLFLALAVSVAVPADAAPRTISVREVSAAAARCGIPGLEVARDGSRWRSFIVGGGEWEAPDLPLSAEREAELRAAERRWNCLVRWGKQRNVSFRVAPPIVRILIHKPGGSDI